MTEIVPRRVWKASNPEGIARTEVETFGWKVHQHVMPVGAKLVIYCAHEVPRASSPNLTLFVRGTAYARLPDGTLVDDRVPGMFSGDRPPTPAGETVLIAAEEFEFWCFNWHANRGALPAVEILRAPQATSFQAESGQRVLLCAGRLGQHIAPCSFVHDGEPLMAMSDSYGFLIGGDRA